jgi:hypothetical protein
MMSQWWLTKQHEYTIDIRTSVSLHEHFEIVMLNTEQIGDGAHPTRTRVRLYVIDCLTEYGAGDEHTFLTAAHTASIHCRRR